MPEFSPSLHLKKASEPVEEDLLFLGFTAGTQAYALGIFAVKEIGKIPRIFSLPKVPSFIKGVIDLRGGIIPVLDFKERLGFGPVDNAKGRVVVATLGEMTLGLLVDSTEEVFRVPQGEIRPAPEIFRKPETVFIAGMVHLGERLYLVLNPREILTSQEVVTLENHAWSADR